MYVEHDKKKHKRKQQRPKLWPWQKRLEKTPGKAASVRNICLRECKTLVWFNRRLTRSLYILEMGMGTVTVRCLSVIREKY